MLIDSTNATIHENLYVKIVNNKYVGGRLTHLIYLTSYEDDNNRTPSGSPHLYKTRDYPLA